LTSSSLAISKRAEAIHSMGSHTSLFAGRYKLIKTLGKGGMGEICLAEQVGHRGFRRRAVIKRILAHRADDDEFRAGFEMEAKLAAQLDHPNIARVEDFGEYEGNPFIVMEYIKGWDLSSLQKRARTLNRTLPVRLVLSVVIDVGYALEHAHTAEGWDGKPLRIVHRDISPHNIMVTPNGRTKLLDFGVASSVIAEEPTQTGQIKGKLRYLSPEQVLTNVLDGRSDQFSLATVLAECLTGARIFAGESEYEIMRSIVQARLPDLDPKGDWPQGLLSIVKRGLSRQPNDRYPDCGAFAYELERILDDVGGKPHSTELHRWLRELAAVGVEDQRLSAATAHEQGHATVPALQPLAPLEEQEIELAWSKPTRPVDAWTEEISVETSWASARPLRHHPTYASRFVGRVDEMVHLAEWIEGEESLVTVLGPGGMGKSRLVAEVLERQVSGRPGGVFFVDLSASHDLDAMLGVTSRALNTPLAGAQSQSEAITRIGRVISSLGRAVVVLDGMEHLVEEAGSVLSVWARLAPKVCFVVTSQRRLGLQVETVMDLKPMGSEQGLKLFVAAAAQAQRYFELAESDRLVVHEIVERLDGIPLAIELAAARVAVLSPRKILDRLEHRFNVLRSRNSEAHDRQQTLRAAVEWSWNLLGDAEKATLAQCSVFAGSFTLEGAEAVVNLAGMENPPFVMDVILNLKDRSLLRSEPLPSQPDELRFSMYETVRIFAQQQLAAGVKPAQDRHAGWILEYCSGLRTHRENKEEIRQFDLLAAEVGNLRAVADRYEDRRGLRALVLSLAVLVQRSTPRLRTALERVRPWADALEDDEAWLEAMYRQIECIELRREITTEQLEDAITRLRALPDAQRSTQERLRLFWVDIFAHYNQFKKDDRLEDWAAFLGQYRDKMSPSQNMVWHFFHGVGHVRAKRYKEAASYYEKACQIAEAESLQRSWIRYASNRALMLSMVGSSEDAERLWRDVARRAKAFDDRIEQALALANIASECICSARFEEVDALLDESERVARGMGNPFLLVQSISTRALFAIAQDRIADADAALTSDPELMNFSAIGCLRTLISEQSSSDLDPAAMLQHARNCDDADEEFVALASAGVELFEASAALASGDQAKSMTYVHRVMQRIERVMSPQRDIHDQIVPALVELNAEYAVYVAYLERRLMSIQSKR